MAELSRRHLLLGTAAVAMAGGAGAVLALRSSSPAVGFVSLNDEELGVVAALSELWFPAGVFPVDGLEADVPFLAILVCDRWAEGRR